LLVVMLDTPCSEVVRRLLATQSIRQFPLQFPSRASTCAITFQPESTKTNNVGIAGRSYLSACHEIRHYWSYFDQICYLE
jgi:hypothetical protein